MIIKNISPKSVSRRITLTAPDGCRSCVAADHCGNRAGQVAGGTAPLSVNRRGFNTTVGALYGVPLLVVSLTVLGLHLWGPGAGQVVAPLIQFVILAAAVGGACRLLTSQGRKMLAALQPAPTDLQSRTR